jgi:hypothetical protein
MATSERTENTFQQRVHAVYGLWAPHHADGEILTTREYNPDEVYQKVEFPRIEPEIDLETAMRMGRISMGEEGFAKLFAGLTEQRVVEQALDRHKEGESTLVAGLHLRDVMDVPMSHNNLFLASGGDPEIAAINDLIANPMLSHISIGEDSVFKYLTASGGVDLALPADAAAEYGMSLEDIEKLERTYGRALNRRLKTGVVVHWALSGTRGKKIITRSGDMAICVRRVEDGIANIVRKKLSLAVPVPMDVQFGNVQVEVLEPRRLDSVDDVHYMMQEMVDVAKELSGEEIYYGLPEGSREVQV